MGDVWISRDRTLTAARFGGVVIFRMFVMADLKIAADSAPMKFPLKAVDFEIDREDDRFVLDQFEGEAQEDAWALI